MSALRRSIGADLDLVVSAMRAAVGEETNERLIEARIATLVDTNPGVGAAYRRCVFALGADLNSTSFLAIVGALENGAEVEQVPDPDSFGGEGDRLCPTQAACPVHLWPWPA